MPAKDLPLLHGDDALLWAEDDLDVRMGMLIIFLTFLEDFPRLKDDELVDVIRVRPPANMLAVPFAVVATVIVVVVGVAADAAQVHVNMNRGSAAVVIVTFPMFCQASGACRSGCHRRTCCDEREEKEEVANFHEADSNGLRACLIQGLLED
jgi:hypothetical protein